MSVCNSLDLQDIIKIAPNLEKLKNWKEFDKKKLHKRGNYYFENSKALFKDLFVIELYKLSEFSKFSETVYFFSRKIEIWKSWSILCHLWHKVLTSKYFEISIGENILKKVVFWLNFFSKIRCQSSQKEEKNQTTFSLFLLEENSKRKNSKKLIFWLFKKWRTKDKYFNMLTQNILCISSDVWLIRKYKQLV